jgi:hypothetical protein
MCSEGTYLSPESPPRAAPSALDRRGFLKVSRAGLLGVVLLGSVGAGKVLAQRIPSPGSSLVAEFEEAAEEYGVPWSCGWPWAKSTPAGRCRSPRRMRMRGAIRTVGVPTGSCP